MIETLNVIGWDHEISDGERRIVESSLANSSIGDHIPVVDFTGEVMSFDLSPSKMYTLLGSKSTHEDSYFVGDVEDSIQVQEKEAILLLTKNKIHDNYVFRTTEGSRTWDRSVFGTGNKEKRLAIVNVDPHRSQMDVPLSYIILHEFGHVQGLDHCTSYRNGIYCVMGNNDPEEGERSEDVFTTDLCVPCQDSLSEIYSQDKGLEVASE
jgi:predicted Zn-dependent protease